MRVTPALEVLWQSAGREAVSAGYEAIEPEHFLQALAIFAVAPLQRWVAWLPGGPSALAELTGEADAVVAAFRRRNLDPADISRRSALPPRPLPGTVATGGLPLAPACEEALVQAAQVAERENARVSAVHLLEAMLQRPPAWLEAVLALNSPEAEPLAVQGPHAAAIRAVVGLLADPCRWNVVLLGESADSRTVVESVARILPTCLGRKVRVCVPPSGMTGLFGSLSESHQASIASAAAEEILLIAPANSASSAIGDERDWTRFFSAAKAGGCQWLVCLTPLEYGCVAGRRRRAPPHARVVRLHPELPPEVPWEL